MKSAIRTAGVVAGLALVLGACGLTDTGSKGSDNDAKEVVLTSYGGTTLEAAEKSWFPDCEKKTGIKIITDTSNDPAKMVAMVKSGNVTWDIVDVDSNYGLEDQGDLFEPLDYSQIPREELASSTTYRASNNIYSTVLAYNTKTLGDKEPQGWADFFDVKRFPGKRGVWDNSVGGILEIALLADGVPADQLYPLDIPRALKKLDTIKDNIVYWSSGAESVDLLSSGEVSMAMMWNARAQAAADQDGAPVAIQWNQHILGYGLYVVPKGAPNKEAAMEVLACVLSKEVNGGQARYVSYAPGNTKAPLEGPYVDNLPTSHLDVPHTEADDQYRNDHFAEIDSAYQAWKK